MQRQAIQAAQLPRRIGWKVFTVLGTVLALAAVVGYALQRELRTTPETPSAAPAAFAGGLAMAAGPLGALSPEEEAYAAALWPIHSEVKLAAMRMTFAGLNYKIEHQDPAKVKATVQPLATTFKSAAQRARQIRPPESLRDAHVRYLEALGLFVEASREMTRVADDRRDEHLVAAHARSEQASHALLQLSDMLWAGEYKPN